MFRSNLHAPFFADILEVSSIYSALFLRTEDLRQDAWRTRTRSIQAGPLPLDAALSLRLVIPERLPRWHEDSKTRIDQDIIKSFSFHRVLNILNAISIYLVNVRIAVSRTFPGDEVRMWVGAFGFRVSGRKNFKRRLMAKSGGTYLLTYLVIYLLTYLLTYSLTYLLTYLLQLSRWWPRRYWSYPDTVPFVPFVCSLVLVSTCITLWWSWPRIWWDHIIRLQWTYEFVWNMSCSSVLL